MLVLCVEKQYMWEHRFGDMMCTLIVLVPLLSACGSYVVEDRLYGEWVEPIHETVVEFQEDGRLNWGEEEGTFSFVRSSNWAVCIGMNGCDDGQIKLNLPGGSFRSSIYRNKFDQNPDEYWISPRNYSAYPVDIPFDGKEVSFLPLYRSGSYSGTLMPTEYTMSNGLPEQSYYHQTMNNLVKINDDTLVGIIGSSLMRLSDDSDIWEEVTEDSYGYIWSAQSGAIVHNDPPNGSDMVVSMDAGLSWTTIENKEGLDGHNDWLIGDQFIRVMYTYDEETGSYQDIQAWTFDLQNPTTGWTTHPMNIDFVVSHFDYEAREEGIFIAESEESGQGESYISGDLGLTWTSFEDECVGEKKLHSNGFYCANASQSLSWFDYDTMGWSHFDVGVPLGYNSFPTSIPETDTVYYLHNEEVHAWNENTGSQYIAPLSSNITDDLGSVHVTVDRVWVAKHTIWSYWIE